MGALVRREPFVPFRNHALTRLLEAGMTGTARVLVIVTATALSTHRDHTLQSLRCAKRNILPEWTLHRTGSKCRFASKMCGGSSGPVDPDGAVARAAVEHLHKVVNAGRLHEIIATL